MPNAASNVPSDLIERIIADASERTGLAGSEITVERGEQVTWNDGSLGCAEPGMAYTQALVDGYWVIVAAGAQSLDYRATLIGLFRYCAFPTADPGTSADQ